ncbi:MAG: thioesterase family protein [Verrucomicrobiota bacterium]
MISSTSRIRVRYAETDKMGIVYHTNYFVWFEMSRVVMLEELGCRYRDLEERGYLLPVLEINAVYKQPAYFDDHVDVTCFMREAPSLRMTIDYEVRRDEKLLASGFSKHAFMSPEGRPVKPPQDILEHFAQYFREDLAADI